VKFGLTPVQALLAGTINSARILGLEGKLGTLEPGKTADLIVVNGDPLKDIEVMGKVHLVIKDGRMLVRDGKAL
jgi:imidazolonepropionase-like amidohydrolase